MRPSDCDTGQLAALEQLFPGHSEMARQLRAIDWSKTVLGPVASWSPTLRMMVGILLANRFPLLLWWGPEYVQIYNDAYIPIPGAKHPGSVAQRASECWTEIWHIIGPLVDAPFHGGPATWMDDLELEINRHGFMEETHFTVAYSPVPDQSAPGGIGGVLATVHEITQQIIQDRRVRILRDLGSRVLETRTAEEACTIAADVFGQNIKDIPFAAIYLLDNQLTTAHFVAGAGVSRGAPCAPEAIALDDADGAGTWPLADVVRGEQVVMVTELATRFAEIPTGAWSEAPHQAIVLPIRSHHAHRPAGIVIFGVSARIALDEYYRSFFVLATAQVATAIANARAYEQERQRAEALAAIDRAKTTFFSNISHEFRTPLTLILGPLEDALATRGEQDPAWGERLDLMRRNALRLQRLVNTLLDFSRIEAGRIEANYEPTDLAAFTSQLASMFQSALQRAGVHLRIDCSTTSEPAYVDREMWEKIVMNLLSNAFKFTLHGEIAVAIRETADVVELTVKDTGVGIPPEEMPRLFERFHRIRQAQARTHEGTGIGLALVQELVRLHGGEIHGDSVLGSGTTFTIRIPRGRAHLPADRINASRGLASTALGATPFVEEALRWLPGSNTATAVPPLLDEFNTSAASRTMPCPDARVVIAEDNADMRDYLRQLLGQYWSVETVTDGIAALQCAQDRQPDLMVSDVMMPGLDGFELLRALRSDDRTRNLPVILLSARAGEDAAVAALAAGADAYLVKPFSARELVAYVAAHLQLQRLRRISQAALSASQAKFSAAFSQSPLALTITAVADGQLVDFNDSFVQLSGYTRDEALGRTIDELNLWIEPEKRTEGLVRLQAGERISGTEARLRMKNGEERVVMIGAAMIEIDQQPHIVSSVADITTHKRTAETLRQSEARLVQAHDQLATTNAVLREADRRKDEFLAMLGHELRNPLSAVRNAVAIASLDASQRAHALEIARRQTDQLGRLIDDLLDVARLTQGRISLRKEPVLLAEVIERAIEHTQSFIESRGIALAVLPDRVPMRLDADPARLEQVFVNLLTNAGKYTDSGGRVSIVTECNGESAVIRIRDTGIGITPEILSRMWDLFAQADRSLDRSQGGLGIGLTVARRLVELHGGRIEAHSDGPGTGAEFVVVLPLLPASSKENPPVEIAAAAPRGVRVLLVEDNHDAAESLAMLLELLGHRVSTAHDGIAALDAARVRVPDLMLVDIGLPGMDGYEVARRVRIDPLLKNIVLVALTGYGRDEDKQNAIAAGFDYHLVKPINPDALSRVILQVRNEAGEGDNDPTGI